MLSAHSRPAHRRGRTIAYDYDPDAQEATEEALSQRDRVLWYHPQPTPLSDAERDCIVAYTNQRDVYHRDRNAPNAHRNILMFIWQNRATLGRITGNPHARRPAVQAMLAQMEELDWYGRGASCTPTLQNAEGAYDKLIAILEDPRLPERIAFYQPQPVQWVAHYARRRGNSRAGG